MVWFVAIGLEGDFLTSDNPVAVPGVGVYETGFTLHYPLSPKYCLCIYDKCMWGQEILTDKKTFSQLHCKCNPIPEYMVERINYFQYCSADECVYAREEKSLQHFI